MRSPLNASGCLHSGTKNVFTKDVILLVDDSDALTAAGIRHGNDESPGTPHDWLTWRLSLHEFALRLFKLKA